MASGGAARAGERAMDLTNRMAAQGAAGGRARGSAGAPRRAYSATKTAVNTVAHFCEYGCE